MLNSIPCCPSTCTITEQSQGRPTFNPGKTPLGLFVSEIKESHLIGQKSSKGTRTLCPAHSSFRQSTTDGYKPLNWPLEFRGQMKTGIVAPGPLTSCIYIQQETTYEQTGTRTWDSPFRGLLLSQVSLVLDAVLLWMPWELHFCCITTHSCIGASFSLLLPWAW